MKCNKKMSTSINYSVWTRALVKTKLINVSANSLEVSEVTFPVLMSTTNRSYKDRQELISLNRKMMLFL